MGPVSVVCICAYGLLSPMFFDVSETCLRLQLHYKQSVGLCLAFLCVCWKTAEGAFFFFFFSSQHFPWGVGTEWGHLLLIHVLFLWLGVARTSEEDGFPEGQQNLKPLVPIQT